MKKLFGLLLAAALAALLAGCGGAPVRPSPAPEATPSETPAETPAPVSAPESSPVSAPEDGPEEAAPPPEARSGVLVAYFSATGTTRGVAERIAALTGADLAEIIPAQPYTDEDLNYSDRTTRASAEQNDPDARPEIADDIPLEGCTTLYLGYPIWWGQAPRILSTFVESHDFSGMTVVPFCTSGSSGIGSSGDTLAGQAGSGTWLQGRRFAAGVGDDALREWIEETGEKR